MKSLLPNPIPVVVAGALGRMGREVVKATLSAQDINLVAAVDSISDKDGLDIGEELGLGPMNIELTSDLEGCLCSISQSVRDLGPGKGAVLIDFTHPSSVYNNARASIAYGVHPVIGTTGLTAEQICELADFASKASIGSAVIPNFSIGMVLLQQAAAAAARFYDNAELVELHHNQKADAPSGTCIKTAEIMEELGKTFNEGLVNEHESLSGARGGGKAKWP